SNGAVNRRPRIGSPRQFQPGSRHGDAVCVRLSTRLVRIRPRRYLAAMGSRRSRTTIRDDGVRRCDRGQHGTNRRRSLSMDAAEGYLPQALSLAHRVSGPSLAPGHARRGGDRGSPWALLPRLLLVLMALLFVGGLMNLAWVGAIALFVLASNPRLRAVRHASVREPKVGR